LSFGFSAEDTRPDSDRRGHSVLTQRNADFSLENLATVWSEKFDARSKFFGTQAQKL
jgi:hypothetical protein